MPSCCARRVPLRGTGGAGDPFSAPRFGHRGFGAGGARWVPSRISARLACSVSLPTLAPLPVLPPPLPPLRLAAHPPALPPPAPRFFVPHSFCLPPQICVVNCFPLSAFLQSVLHPLPQAVSASPSLSSISHLSHDPFSRPATRRLRPRAVACSYAASVKCCRFLFMASPEILCFGAGGRRALPSHESPCEHFRPSRRSIQWYLRPQAA
jgi:hypothetical protein